MKITRDVVTDLLPVYLAGEASEDTRRLVDEFLQTDPEFAAVVARQAVPPVKIEFEPPRENELKTLENTKALLRKRSNYLGLAIFLTLFPASFRGGSEGFQWIWAESPTVIIASLTLAVLMWISFVRTSRSLKGSNL